MSKKKLKLAAPKKVVTSNEKTRNKRKTLAHKAALTAGPNAAMHLEVMAMIERAKKRAKTKTKRVPCNLGMKDVATLANANFCPVTGLPFVIGTARDGNRPHPMSLSLDRIVPALGYTTGNVQVVSFWANSARNTLTEEQFRTLVLATAGRINACVLH